mmetsp:Transcript_35154/g.59189  ORF Transcript_35154/g.59189 Transcript_35154/m.59189 type:complete len:309 (-) Transcript_35154:3728-4654(-)
MDASQRVRSPARPVTSFSARFSLSSKSVSSSSSFCFEAVLSSYLSLSACTLASTSESWSLATCSCACFFVSVSIAFFSLALLGATSFEITPYTSILLTHMQSPLAAPDTLPMVSGVNSGCEEYLLIFLIKASLIWSLSNTISLFRNDGSPNCFLHSSHVGGRFSTVITPHSTSSTSGGGLAYAFSSEMSFLVSTLRAASASMRAGRALSRPAWQSAEMTLASSASFSIFDASAFTCFSCSSATRLSCTMVTSSSSQSRLALATTTFFSIATTCIVPTCTPVSSSFSSPPLSFCALSPISARFSFRRFL